ncbi:hypothetical protein J437_LFUL014946 [Ladona fulva]|uniref:Dynein heavy chain C-terminal domain-containing protein n=1 Tax=Ladona fulva TaxID=123851 RepID=A0A8K0P565_LADFU|nr:hypothetical protein J437_LFUL014946 [Ladona fulva]
MKVRLSILFPRKLMLINDIKFQLKKIYGNLERPEEGVLIHGLYLDAAGWDLNGGLLTDPIPGEMNQAFPAIHLLPKEISLMDDNSRKYICPLYKTPQRAGVLSTTGHSTNFIMALRLPTNRPESYWILQGTALITQTA